METPLTETLRGSITSVGFASGDRFVIGDWEQSPIDAFADVMWAKPDGDRVLLGETKIGDYVTSVYPFHETRDCEVTTETKGRTYRVRSGALELKLTFGSVIFGLPPRPRWFTATVENWFSRRLLAVDTYGTSPTGVVEWYQTRTVRRIIAGTAIFNGANLGSLTHVHRPLNFGFTDPPRWPTKVGLKVTLQRN